jgi:hypothetical protein
MKHTLALLSALILAGCGAVPEHDPADKAHYFQLQYACSPMNKPHGNTPEERADWHEFTAGKCAELIAFRESLSPDVDEYFRDEFIDVYGGQILEASGKKPLSVYYGRSIGSSRSAVTSGESTIGGSSSGQGIPMYDEDDCIGPVIMGECKGTILSPGPPKSRCYGSVLNGECIGPEF